VNILVVTQYFWPENFRVNELVSDLAARGHQVTVLTGQPNYPGGRFFEGYGRRGPREEQALGARIVRVPMLARGAGGGARLALNFLSFAASASLAAYTRLKGPHDAIFVFEVSPVTVGIPAVVASRRFDIPILFWVLDLWPETLVATGAVRARAGLWLVGLLVRWIYRNSARVLVASRAFVDNVTRYGARRAQVRYFPNWIEAEFHGGTHADISAWRLPQGFCIVYAGNIGASQGFAEIVTAAEEVAMQCPEVRWIIAGDGRMAGWVRDEVARRGLSERFLFLGQQPQELMPPLFAAADALIVGLKTESAESVFAQTVPGKVQSYLAAGRPILAMLDGEGARVVNEAGAGLACPAGNITALAARVRELVAMDPAARAAMGERGRAYAHAEFDRKTLFDRLASWFAEAVKEHACRKT
jgi:glycosyltransferase involved in cell wall biosynthesis